MEYLIYLAFFGLGWVLAKADAASRIRDKLTKGLEDVAVKAYWVGHKQGKKETMILVNKIIDSKSSEKVKKDVDAPQSMGFDLTVAKKDY